MSLSFTKVRVILFDAHPHGKELSSLLFLSVFRGGEYSCPALLLCGHLAGQPGGVSAGGRECKVHRRFRKLHR